MSASQASLTWKLRQQGRWLSVNAVFPPESAARVACTLLREFAGRRFTPLDLDITGETKRFHYQSDGMVIQLRRISEPSDHGDLRGKAGPLPERGWD